MMISRKAARRLRSLFPSWRIMAKAALGPPAKAIVERADAWKPDLLVVGSSRRHPLTGILLGSVALQVLLHARCPVRIGRKTSGGRTGGLKILIGVDGSGSSADAVEAVAGRKWPKNTSIRLLTVLDPRLPVELSADAWRRRSPGKGGKRDWTQAMHADFLAKVEGPGLRADAKTVLGDPRRELLKAARAWKADAIFLGDQGMGAWARFLLGRSQWDWRYPPLARWN